jgi:hypothetical protein
MAKSPKNDDPTQDPAFKRVVRHFLNKKPEHKTGKDKETDQKRKMRPEGAT